MEKQNRRSQLIRPLMAAGLLLCSQASLAALGDTWNQVSPGHPSILALGCLYDGNQFYVVGSQGKIMRSSNGRNAWQSASTGTTQSLLDITFSGSRYVAVGRDTLLVSDDGLAWRPSSAPPSSVGLVRSIAWSPTQNLFVAVGDNVVLTSPDGDTWTAIDNATLPQATFSLQDITWDQNRFLAAGSNGLIWSSPDGSNWTSLFTGPDSFTTIATDGSGHVYAGPTQASTDNGNTWSSVSLANIADAVWTGTEFTVINRFGSIFSVTPPGSGTGWSTTFIRSPAADLLCLAHDTSGNRTLFAGKTIVLSQNKGSTLTATDNTVTMSDFVTMARSNNRFLAIDRGRNVFTSTDGRSWSPAAGIPVGNDVRKIAWGHGRFVGVGTFGTLLSTSDGQSWVSHAISSVTGHINDINADGPIFVAAGDAGVLLYSTDGTTWNQSPQSGSITGNFTSITWDGSSTYYAVSNDRLLFISNDGINWSQHSTTLPNAPTGIAADNSRIILSTSRNLYASTDGGQTWTSLGSPSGTGFAWSVKRINNRYYAHSTAEGSGLWTSLDGSTWTRVAETDVGIVDLSGDNQILAAVGEGGLILVSSTTTSGTSPSGSAPTGGGGGGGSMGWWILPMAILGFLARRKMTIRRA